MKNYYTLLRHKLWKLRYGHKPYQNFYKTVMAKNVKKNPQLSIGGLWKAIGKFEFNFLVKQGLKPHHKLLDFGCGCLRGGLHFIKYLDTGNYYGVDISSEVLEIGKKFLIEADLKNKKPSLMVNENLKFNNFSKKTFDFILVWSVFSHMPLKDIEKVFKNIHKVMNKKTSFFATFHDGGKKIFITRDYENFYYPFDVLQEVGENYGYKIILVEGFVHPHNQKMMKISLTDKNYK